MTLSTSSIRRACSSPAVDNDPLLLAAVPDMTEFVVQEGTGAILHDDGGSTWSDASGNVWATGVRVLAWSQAGVALAVQYPMATSLPVLIEAEGAVTTAVTGIDLSNNQFLSARVRGSGFWLLVARISDPVTMERWTIAADGTATLDGYFASAGPNSTLDIGLSVAGVAALDGSGAAWALIQPGGPVSDSYVHRLELEPGAATSVVGDPPAGVNHDDVYPLNPFLVTGRSTVNCGIITGP